MKRLLTFLGVAGLALAVDQIAKWQVVQNLALGETWVPIPALHPLFRVTRSFNTGAAFGLFPSGSQVFLVLAFVAVVVFTIMYFRMEDDSLLALASIPLIVGGALGNAIDRLRFGHVVDFFHVQVGDFANISNFADHAITLGVILLLIEQIQQEVALRSEEAEAEEDPLAIEDDMLTAVEDIEQA